MKPTIKKSDRKEFKFVCVYFEWKHYANTMKEAYEGLKNQDMRYSNIWVSDGKGGIENPRAIRTF